MGDFFTIPDDIKSYAAGVFDDSLREFGDVCKLTYESTEEVCPNCLVNPRTGESTGRYKDGGPVPFELGEVCPVCDGRGRVQGTGSFDLITMTIDWRPKPFLDIGSGSGAEGDRLVRVPGGAVVTRGFISDLPKVQRANYAILDINNQHLTNKFKLYGSPYPLGAIVKHRYFGAVWERVN
jgi:hypothetical protein